VGAARAIASMAERYERPAWVRRVNAMATAVGGARRLVLLEAASLLEGALASLGGGPAGDFGDPAWQTRFESLVAALDATNMHVVGRLLTREELLRSLRTRLLLARELERKPAILDERIEAPLIVTGPARSGTTITFELLWLDPALRGPTAWEALHPVPLPEGGGADARLAASECEQELWADIQPEFAAIHELRSDLPVECVTLTAPCFCGPHWPMVAQMGGYAGDIEEMYRFHRRILQALQHGAARRTWLLKTPAHLMTLDLLHATYPDAWIVQTHRDPAKTMPSTVSTTAMVQWMRSDDVDAATLSAAVEGMFGFALNNVAELRRTKASPLRFVDVHFQDLMKDPVETLRRAYAVMGREFGDAHAERIQRYLAEKPKGKFGTHRYAPEDWGFSAQSLREHLKPYIEYFGVALED
jgi:sulfotransferase family protein